MGGTKKAGAGGKSKSKGGAGGRKCGRCGRPNHTSRTCNAKTHANGHNLKTINCPRCLRPIHAHLGPCDFKTDIHGRKVTEEPYTEVCVPTGKRKASGQSTRRPSLDDLNV